MRFALAILFSLFAVLPALAACDDGEAVFKLGLVEEAETTPRRSFAKRFVESANAALQGKACVEVILSNDLYEDDEALEALRAETIQLAVPRLEKLTVASPKLIVFSLPFAFRDHFALDSFLASADYRAMLQPVEASGFAALGQLHDGFYQLAGSRPVHVPDDVRGLRFRRADAPDLSTRPDLLGASSRVVRDDEFADALTKKLVEAVTATWSVLAANNADKLLDGATEMNHRYTGYMLVASKTLWDALDKDVRERLSKAATEALAATNAATRAKEKAAMASMIDRGSPVRTLTGDQRDDWMKTLQPMWDRVAGDDALMLAIRRANAMP